MEFKGKPATESSSVLLDCFHYGMKNLLGEGPMQAVLFHLQFADLVDDPARLHKNLTSLFGEPATVIEKAIVKELFQRVGLPYEEGNNFEFVKSVNLAKTVLVTRLEVETR